VDLLEIDRQAMPPLPPLAPAVGLSSRIRLGRDYYVRIDTNDYSLDPEVIGRFVDVAASMSTVTVTCEGQQVARHPRSWAKAQVLTDPAHVESAARLRSAYNTERHRRQAAASRHHADGHGVALRALADYDALFGVDFTTSDYTKASSE
jgi:Mu transposase-like protein